MSTEIRYFSACEGNDIFLAAEFEKVIYVFRKGKNKKERTVKTNFDFGGQRLQLVPETESFISGAYQQFGIESYSLSTGTAKWKRKDLTKIQKIIREPATGRIYCIFDDLPGLVVDSQTGKTIEKLPVIKNIFFSKDGKSILVKKSGYIVRDKMEDIFTIKPESLAVLDTVFSPSIIAISESGANVRFFSVETGDRKGTYVPDKGHHVLSMVYNSKSKLFIGLLWGYDSAGDYYLIHLTEKGQEKKRLPVFNGYAHIFFLDRNSFLNASGHEVDLDSGSEIFQYDFQ